MAKPQRFTEDQLMEAVRTSYSIRAVLRLHHLDGDRTNNQLSNIELLCPNCYAFTNSYRGGKKKV